MGIAERKAREFKKREEEILSTAFNLFLEFGLENVTIEQIAEAVEIGKGTIYKHFKSKHEIYASLFIRHLEKISAEVDNIDQTLPVDEQFRKIIRIYIRSWIDNKAHSTVFQKCFNLLTIENLGPELLEKVKYYHKLKHDQHLPLIKKAIEEGVVMDANPMHLLIAASGMLSGVSEMLSTNHFDIEIDNPEGLYKVIEEVLVKGFMR